MNWIFPFLVTFKVILLQVLGLAVAVSVLQLLFPVFTQMVVDRVIVENDLGLLKIIMLGMFAAHCLCATVHDRAGISAGLRGRAARYRILDFLSRKLLSLPMSLFH